MPVASEAMLLWQPACTQPRSSPHPTLLTSFHVGGVLEAAEARGALVGPISRRAWVKKTVWLGGIFLDVTFTLNNIEGLATKGDPGRQSWEEARARRGRWGGSRASLTALPRPPPKGCSRTIVL